MNVNTRLFRHTLFVTFAAAIVATAAIGCGSTDTDSSPNVAAGQSSFDINPSPCSVAVGSSITGSVSLKLVDGGQQDITDQATWKSNNTNVLTVSSTGTISGVNAGVTQVVVDYNGGSASLDCTVR